ncbi:asparagine synthase (glutamine-hydrolyzing) [Roseibium sediminis]|uniref:asparagine synthase (glutamine-hydrolyzing) n=1 Tax=Roseibium sediminis TaxID=1775174 RepID=UPI00123CC70F|nr:asparagine synthase (glutamine-hydrolyzing) [Roseibium sediminis]
MCGIAGLFSTKPNTLQVEFQRELVVRMTDRIIHRGPDQAGLWADPLGRCTLGHRRLSIIDVSDAGIQPMGWNNEEWIIAFNGEIYNFLELRQELEAKGVRFTGRTDTEVLLAALATWGLDCLERLDGMYAFAAFHRPSGRLILARDPFGEKPLYYMPLRAGGMAFASELQCFEDLPEFTGEVSADALSELLMFQYIGAPRTIYQQVYKLPPGHWMEVREGQPLRTNRFFRFQPGAAGYSARSQADLADELEDILIRSLRRRLIADVPLGAFLSGGVDSSTVCALITKKLDVPLKTFSIGFAADRESEHEIARRIAAHLGTEHRDKIVSPSAVGFLDHAGQLLDEPNADSSCLPTYLLSQFARQHVTVALSGDGGDELFGGYGRYFDTLSEADSHAMRPANAWSPGKSYYYSNRIMNFSPAQLSRLFGFIPAGAANHVRSIIAEIDDGPAQLLDRLRASDADNYMPGAVLPKVDRMSMQHSLEVRTPFLSIELARFAERVPGDYLVRNGRGKLLLREIAYRYLPREIIDLPKKGFGLPLTADWGKAQLVSALRDSLGVDSPLGNWIGPDRARKFVDSQASTHGFSIYQVWTVIMLDKWLRKRPVHLPDTKSLEIVAQSDVPRYYAVSGDNRTRLVGFVTPSVLVVSSPTTTSPVEDAPIRSQLGLFDSIDLHLLALASGIDLSEIAETDADERVHNTFHIDADRNIVDGIRDLHINLADCSVIILDRAPEWVGYNDILHLRAMRLRTLIVPQRHRADGNWMRYEFNHPTLGKRILNLVRLLPHIQAVWMPRLSCGIQSQEQVAGSFKRLPAAVDHESAVDFAVFDGPVQYLPYLSSHQEIKETTERRYSIWNQHVVYSQPHRSRRWYVRPLFWLNWLVPINGKTTPFLPIASMNIDVGRHVGTIESGLRHLVTKTNQNPAVARAPDFIVLYTHGLSSGGAERQWCNLAIGLKELGKRVCIVVDTLEGPNNHYLPLTQRAGIEVLHTNDLKEDGCCRFPFDSAFCPLLSHSTFPAARNVQRLANLLTRLKPDTVIAQLDGTNIVGAIAALIADVPKIAISFRNYNPTHFDYLDAPWYLPAYRALVGSNRLILTGNSRAGNIDYAEWIGIDPARVELLQNSYAPDTRQFLTEDEKREFKQELGISPATKVILGVFRLSTEKNPVLFVDVCADVLDKHPDAVALLCGEGSKQSDVEAQINARGIGERFLLQGRRSDIWKYISIADVLLLTSDKEGTPNVIREALMLRCPVVATSSGAVPEMIENGVTGYLTTVGDRAALSQRLLRLLTDDVKYSQMVAAIVARPYRFTPRDNAQQLLEILKGTADAGGRADALKTRSIAEPQTNGS